MALEDIDARFQLNAEDYFYILNDGDDFVYGGHFTDDVLTNFLIDLYYNEPASRPDLLKFAEYVLRDTGN